MCKVNDPNELLSGKRGEARTPFGAECGKTSNLQLYRVSTFRRDGPGKKSRTNSHRLAEWPQSVCLTSWCIDLCATMQRARVFSSLLYQDVMVFDVPEKDPCKKPSPHKAAELHTQLHTAIYRPAVCVRPHARPRACTGARFPGRRPRRRPRGRGSGFRLAVHAGWCGGGAVRPGRCRLTPAAACGGWVR